MATTCHSADSWDQDAAQRWWETHLPELTGPFVVGFVGYFRAEKGGVGAALAAAMKLADVPGIRVRAGFWNEAQQRQAAAALRESLKPYTQAIKKLEGSMDNLRRKLSTVEKELADPQLYTDNNERLALLLKEQGNLKSEIETIEEQWLLKSEELEAVKASDGV